MAQLLDEIFSLIANKSLLQRNLNYLLVSYKQNPYESHTYLLNKDGKLCIMIIRYLQIVLFINTTKGRYLFCILLISGRKMHCYFICLLPCAPIVLAQQLAQLVPGFSPETPGIVRITAPVIWDIKGDTVQQKSQQKGSSHKIAI